MEGVGRARRAARRRCRLGGAAAGRTGTEPCQQRMQTQLRKRLVPTARRPRRRGGRGRRPPARHAWPALSRRGGGGGACIVGAWLCVCDDRHTGDTTTGARRGGPGGRARGPGREKQRGKRPRVCAGTYERLSFGVQTPPLPPFPPVFPTLSASHNSHTPARPPLEDAQPAPPLCQRVVQQSRGERAWWPLFCVRRRRFFVTLALVVLSSAFPTCRSASLPLPSLHTRRGFSHARLLPRVSRADCGGRRGLPRQTCCIRRKKQSLRALRPPSRPRLALPTPLSPRQPLLTRVSVDWEGGVGGAGREQAVKCEGGRSARQRRRAARRWARVQRPWPHRARTLPIPQLPPRWVAGYIHCRVGTFFYVFAPS